MRCKTIGPVLIRQPVLVNVLYWMPDYNNVLQEFMWGTEDVVPEYPRIHKFLNYWHYNIDAVISEVLVAHTTSRHFRSVDWQSHLPEH